MICMQRGEVWIRLLLFLLVATCLAARVASRLVEPVASLYNNSQGITSLDPQTFESSIFGRGNAVLVKFYANWCGHCITFAPKFKRLARDVIAWRSVISLTAVNCADSVNLDICRDQAVVAYPTLKFFPPFSQPGSQGKEFVIIEQTTNSMRKSLIHYVTEYIRSINPRDWASRLSSWPQIMPFNVSSQSQLIRTLELPYEAKPVLMVIEGPPATSADVALEVIMDLSSYQDSVIIRRMLYHSSNLRKVFASRFVKGLLIPDPESQITQYPLLVRLKSEADKKLRVELLQASNETMTPSVIRRSFVHVIASRFLRDKWIDPSAMVTSLPNESDAVNSSSSDGLSTTPFPTHGSDPLDYKIYMVDLSNAVRYSLFQETLLHQGLNSSETSALKKYLYVLSKYFPFENDGQKRWVRRVSQWLNQRNETKAASLHAVMKSGAEGSVFPLRPYISCHGSKPDLRGYPCALWLLFHTLTMQEYVAMSKSPALRHTVLFAMRDYVRYFFTCKYCSQEFNIAARSLEHELTGSESSVLWLWRVHNDVNRRLQQTETEDPAHPKTIFPDHELCPECWEERTKEWKLTAVLSFLRAKYDRRYLIRRLPNLSYRTHDPTHTSLFLFSSLLLSLRAPAFLLST